MGNLLIVEDNPGDERLLLEALRAANCGLPLDVVRDGEKAIAYLRQEPPFEQKLRSSVDYPDLISREEGGGRFWPC